MERYSLFLDRKNQYCENEDTTKCNVYNSYQITNGIFYRTRAKNFTIHMEIQKTLNSQSSLEKEEWSWMSQPFLLWTMGSEMKVAQLCPTLCDPMDCTVHGILQARILEWVAFPFSRGSSQPRDQTRVSCIADGFFTS